MANTENGRSRIKHLLGVLFIIVFVLTLSASFQAAVKYTSELLPYEEVVVPESLTLYIDKDITLKKLWARKQDGNKVYDYDLQIIAVGSHTLTVDGRLLADEIKNPIQVHNLIIHDGVNLEVLSNAIGLYVSGDLTISKANVSIQCFDKSSMYYATYVLGDHVNLIGSEIAEPKGAYLAGYTIRDPSTYNSAMKVRIAPIKDKNPIAVIAKKVTVKASKVKNKNQAIKRAKYLTVSNAQGKLSYKLTKVTKTKFKKYFKVNASTGKITVKKGLKKGTYKLKIKVTAAGNSNYLSGETSVTVTVKVK